MEEDPKENEPRPSSFSASAAVPLAHDIPTLCLLAIALVAIVYALSWLEDVLVPITLAAGMAQLAEPLLGQIVRLPNTLAWLARRACRSARQQDAARGQLLDIEGALPTEGVPRWRQCGRSVRSWVQSFWELLSVALCTLVLLGCLSIFGFITVMALEKFNWPKYRDSFKWKEIAQLLESWGIDFKTSEKAVFEMIRGELMMGVSSVLSFSANLMLTLLMFFFCLIAMLPQVREPQLGGRSELKKLTQQYLKMKTIASLVVGFCVGVALKLLKVDLAEIFGLLTFLLNYIPNLGSAIACLAPVPLVLLDPEQHLNAVIWVVAIPFAIHNTVGTMVETKLVSKGVDLHPLTVLVALTFWSSVWGVSGAVLSVPITSVIRFGLEQSDHHYAKAVRNLLQGKS